VNAKKARAQRQARQPAAYRNTRRSSFWTERRMWIAGGAAVAIVAASFVLPGLLNRNSTSSGAEHAMAGGAKMGEGLPAGSAVPSFAARDVETGRPITSKTLFGKKTLLFFSEGVMCQACFQQIKDVESFGNELGKRGISLVSITPDSAGELDQVIRQIGITTPMIADSDRSMSEAFNTLGKGMHSDTPGHAFALIHRGTVLWYRDYWLPPYRTMYVKPAKLLADIPA
jgi:peroxiredoxin